MGRTRGRDDGRLLPSQPGPDLDAGGLNFQIEHHLFPRVPHTHYPQIARIVRSNCATHGVRYSSQPSLRAALRSHFLHLRAMGRLGLPAESRWGNGPGTAPAEAAAPLAARSRNRVG